jgi:Zn finger protein HypA/HybF involved in hydrogenase expression
MDSNQADSVHAMMLDGNAAAGILSEIFAVEMTNNWVECANCGRQGEIGTLLAFMQAPGVVLRCPTCEQVILRVVQSTEMIYLDLRGAAFVSFRVGGAVGEGRAAR